MNKPLAKTFLMGLIALVTSGIAAFFFPWPEPVVESAAVGKPLFEEYETSAVRSMRIMQYNDDKGEVERIIVRRRGQKWVIPSRKEFIANNVAQYTASANCLNERTVLEEQTDNQQDHLEYGVIDPIDFSKTSNPSGLGKKIILEDRQGRVIANLIVGRRVKDDKTKHYVRIPGQPTVYVCEFDPRAVETDFGAWVDPNLFDLTGEVPVNEIAVENYRLDPKNLKKKTQMAYRATMSVGRQQLNLRTLSVGGSNGEWKKIPFTQNASDLLQKFAGQMLKLPFTNVQRKSAEMARALEAPKADQNTNVFAKLAGLGFVSTGYENESFQFDGAAGEVRIETMDGVSVTMYIGDISKERADSNFQVSRYVMLCAGVNEKALPMPIEPEYSKDAEKAKQEEKTYLRKVETRNGKLQNSRIRAAELNQQFADWIYMIPEDVIENLRPDLELPTSEEAATAATAAPDVEDDPFGGNSSEQEKPESQKSEKSPETPKKDDSATDNTESSEEKSSDGNDDDN
jgi:hypothetical protein